MASSNKETSTQEDPVALGQASLQQFADAGLGPLQWMGTGWFKAMADLNSEVASFVAERIRQDVKTQHELMHCKTAQELQKAQAAFLGNAYEQYTTETGKLVKMGMDMLPTATSSTKDTPI